MAQTRNNGNRKFTIFAILLLPRIKTVADPSSLTPKALFLSDVSYAYAIPNPKADPTKAAPDPTKAALWPDLDANAYVRSLVEMAAKKGCDIPR